MAEVLRWTYVAAFVALFWWVLGSWVMRSLFW